MCAYPFPKTVSEVKGLAYDLAPGAIFFSLADVAEVPILRDLERMLGEFTIRIEPSHRIVHLHTFTEVTKEMVTDEFLLTTKALFVMDLMKKELTDAEFNAFVDDSKRIWMATQDAALRSVGKLRLEEAACESVFPVKVGRGPHRWQTTQFDVLYTWLVSRRGEPVSIKDIADLLFDWNVARDPSFYRAFTA